MLSYPEYSREMGKNSLKRFKLKLASNLLAVPSLGKYPGHAHQEAPRSAGILGKLLKTSPAFYVKTCRYCVHKN
jgi:hypothetical protein